MIGNKANQTPEGDKKVGPLGLPTKARTYDSTSGQETLQPGSEPSLSFRESGTGNGRTDTGRRYTRPPRLDRKR